MRTLRIVFQADKLAGGLFSIHAFSDSSVLPEEANETRNQSP